MILPQRALYILADYCGLNLKGKTCRARTCKGTVCKHKRPTGRLFCKNHTESYSRKVGIQKSLHTCRGTQMKFGEYLAIFGETIKAQNLRWPSVALKPLANCSLGAWVQPPRNHIAERMCDVERLGPVFGCKCRYCVRVRRLGDQTGEWHGNSVRHYCQCLNCSTDRAERYRDERKGR